MNRKLPILISIPHGSVNVPADVEDYCRLSETDIVQDSDEGALEIYDFHEVTDYLITAEVARAIVDLNRLPEDLNDDGVIKSLTINNIPIYRRPLPNNIIHGLLRKYYYPFHQKLTDIASSGGVKIGFDCHTMAAVTPPITDSEILERPHICIGDLGGKTVPTRWREVLINTIEQSFDLPVSINQPFSGGYIISKHHCELPWVQIELSRSPFFTNEQKRERLVRALKCFMAEIDY